MLYGNIAERCIEVIREICSANYIDIISGNISSDHTLISASLTNKAGWICDCYFLKIYKNTAIPNLDAEQIVISKIVQYIKGKVAENYEANSKN